jgi:hypothetical protein
MRSCVRTVETETYLSTQEHAGEDDEGEAADDGVDDEDAGERHEVERLGVGLALAHRDAPGKHIEREKEGRVREGGGREV